MRHTFGIISLLTIAATAHAQDTFEAPGLLAPIPAGIAASGQDYRLLVVARSPDGTAITDARVKATVDAGRVRSVSHLGSGIYAVELVAPSDASTMAVEVTGKTPSKEAISASWTVPVASGHPASVALTAAPERMLIGEHKTAALTFDLGAGTGPIETRASKGAVDVGAGSYTAGDVKFPHLGIVTAVSPHDAEDVYGFVVIPLDGNVPFPVKGVPAGAEVTIKFGGQTFGPVTADGAGKARVPLVVPPGVEQATLLAVSSEGKESSNLDLKVPDSQRLLFFPPVAEISRDPARTVPIRLVVVRPNGKPDPGAAPTMTASVGSIGAAKHQGKGVYTAEYTPPAEAADTVDITAEITGEKNQTDTISFALFDPDPSRLALRTVPEPIPADAENAAVYVYVEGPGKDTATAADVSVDAVGTSAASAVTASGGGVFAVSYTLDGSGMGSFAAAMAPAATGKEPLALVVAAARSSVPNDGATANSIVITALDAYGRPVPGVDVALELTSGGGTLPRSAKTRADGSATVKYVAGAGAAVVGVKARSGAISAGTGFVQGPASAVPARLPPAGTAITIEAFETWSQLHPVIDFGAAAAPVAAEVATTESATKEPKEAKAPKERDPGDGPPMYTRVALAGGFGTYGYLQDPDSNDPGNLITQQYSVGMGRSGPATTVGFQATGLGWLHDFVGWEASFGVNSQTMVIPGFENNPIPNPRMQVRAKAIGRYALDVGGNTAWAGLAAGLHYDSVLVLEGSLTGALSYRRIGTPNAAFGLMAGMENEGSWWGDLGFGLEAGRGSANELRLRGGYTIADPWQGTVQITRQARKITVNDDTGDHGITTDRALQFRFGVARDF